MNDRILKLLTVTYCFGFASDLIITWRTNVSEQPAAFAFLLWMIPAVAVSARQPRARVAKHWLLFAGVNVYLHYVLDEWFHNDVLPCMRARAHRQAMGSQGVKARRRP